jgi:hypothetical protein
MGDTANQKVVIWARGRQGHKVGSGECWDLADAALRKAGAKSSDDLGPSGKDVDYVWGDPVQLKDALPGDILQFRDFTITTETVTEAEFIDGSATTRTRTETKNRGHHTAIVDQVQGPATFQILEQHVKPLGPVVQRHVIQTVSGETTKTTNQQARTLRGKLQSAKVIQTVRIKVSGTVTAYRPKPN